MSYIIPNIETPEKNSKSAYGELLTANRNHIAQITATYGILDDTFTATLGGSTTTNTGNFEASTGATSTGISSIATDAIVSYRAGQGLGCMISSVFDTPQAQSTQIAGFTSSDSLIGFGYNGTDFGIGIGKNGKLEIQRLDITASATATENATIVVDGVTYTVPLTAGDTSHTAWEIATYLQTNNLFYNFSSNANSVYCVAKLPTQGSGTFSFASATATGNFTEIQSGTPATETWVNQANWNVKPGIQINPQMGNVYMIQFSYLGYGDTLFYVYDPSTSKFELVHIDKYVNTATTPKVERPAFRCGWAVRNSGNTTNLTIKGASATIFIEGAVSYDATTKADYSQPLIDTTEKTVICFRNKLIFNSSVNRINATLKNISLSTESSKIAVFKLYENPVFSADPQFVDHSANSTMEIAKSQVDVISGDVLACLSVTKESPLNIDASEFVKILKPNKTYAITAYLTSGTSSISTASISWLEDF